MLKTSSSSIKTDRLFLLHTRRRKKDWQTVMCLILGEINGYLLPLGVILTEAYSSRVSWQFWWFVKSGQVSALRLKSQKWLKRFFLERSAVGQLFQTASLASSSSASKFPGRPGWHRALTRISFTEKICMKFGLFRSQINTLDGVFCSILVASSRKVN